jgi:hypothetical protein
MNIRQSRFAGRGNILKSLLAVVLWGAMSLGIGSGVYGGGIDLGKRGNAYGLVAQIEMEAGRVFTGIMYVVDSSHTLARDAASSGNFNSPFATIDYAFSRVGTPSAFGANNANLILVMPGHAETIISADQIDHDVAGVAVWGVGNGSERPTLTYTVAAGEYTIGANNAIVGNIRFLSSVTDVLKAVNIEANVTDAKIINCWFGVDSSGTDEFTECIDLTGTNTRTRIEGNTFNMGIGGAVQAIDLDAVCAQVTIRNNTIRGDYSTADISGDTTLSTNILIEDNLLVNGVGGNINGQPAIELLTGTTGVIRNNDIVCDLATMAASIVSDTTLWFENYYNEDIGTGTGALIGLASGDD